MDMAPFVHRLLERPIYFSPALQTLRCHKHAEQAACACYVRRKGGAHWILLCHADTLIHCTSARHIHN